jgi:hypothetical protein
MQPPRPEINSIRVRGPITRRHGSQDILRHKTPGDSVPILKVKLHYSQEEVSGEVLQRV